MGFSDKAKLTALAIVHCFETSRPFGDYSAVAVLNDGAGVSYGINQFTHRSGSLYAVVNTYLGDGGLVGREAMENVLEDLKAKRNILKVSEDLRFKNALRAAGKTPEMRLAQNQIAENFYLLPAIAACEGSGFTLPLSLAVIYDSINHGSYERIRDRVQVHAVDEEGWITEYVRRRDAWLESIPRLAVTDYRTDFFLAQIARGNWNLDLPLNVHGVRLTDAMFGQTDSADELPAVVQPVDPVITETATLPAVDQSSPAQPPIFVAEKKAVDAPEPTGFLQKLKVQGAALLAFIGGGAGIKEWFGVSLTPETADLLKVLVPTVLSLGFLGFLVWYVAEKVIGFKTLKLQADLATDPTRHDLVINAK